MEVCSRQGCYLSCVRVQVCQVWCAKCGVPSVVCQVWCAKCGVPSVVCHPCRKSNGISICTRVAPLMDKYRHMSAATASTSRAVKYETQDLEGGLAQHKRQPPQELQDIRSRAFTAPAMDHYTGPAPGHPTPPVVGAGATFTPLHPYSTPPPAFPTYPSVGFNTSAPDLPTPYPMYPPPGNQAGYTQGYPPQVGYPPVHPPQGRFPVSIQKCSLFSDTLKNVSHLL